MPILLMGFERGQMSTWSQHCASALSNPQLEVLSIVLAFCLVTSFSMGFEHVEMFEHNQKMKGVEPELAIREQVQPEEACMKGHMLSAEIESIDKEVLQHVVMFHSCQDVNLVPISNRQQEFVVETS